MSASPLRLHAAPSPAADLDAERMIDVKELCQLLAIGRSTAERLKAAGKLPPHVAITKTIHRWRLGTVREWLAERETVSKR
jgi:predicted DNA-binding transcriptional regulator AlpA